MLKVLEHNLWVLATFALENVYPASITSCCTCCSDENVVQWNLDLTNLPITKFSVFSPILLNNPLDFVSGIIQQY